MLGFAGAFRKSEVDALNVEDLDFCDEGVRVTIRRSKTDQGDKGQTIGVLRGAGPFFPCGCCVNRRTPLASSTELCSGLRPASGSAADSAAGHCGFHVQYRRLGDHESAPKKTSPRSEIAGW